MVRLIGILLNMLILSAAIGLAVGLAVTTISLPFWVYYPVLLAMAAALYVSHAILIALFIKKQHRIA